MRVLVTGATGYLGAHVARALAAARHDVLALIRPQRRSQTPAGCTAVAGDVLDPASLERALDGCDAVVHLAGFVKMWARDRRQFDRVNVEGLAAVLRAAERCSVKRAVVTSTVAALGPTGPEPADETHERRDFRFRTDYERTKWLADRYLREHGGALPVVTVYPGVIYGPGAATQGNLLESLLRDFAAGRLKTRLGPVTGRICYAYAADVAEGHRLALERGTPGRGYVLGGENVTQDELFSVLAELTGRPAPRLVIPFWLAESLGRVLRGWARLTDRPPAVTDGAIATFRYHWCYSSARAASELGYRMTPLREGLRLTLASGRAQLSAGAA